MFDAKRGVKHNDEARAKMSATANKRGGRCWMTLNGSSTLVYKDEVQIKLNDGWKLGRT